MIKIENFKDVIPQGHCPLYVGEIAFKSINGNCPVISGDPEKYYDNLYPPEVWAQLSDKEKEYARQIEDPIVWAKHNLLLKQGGFEPRKSQSGYPYQANIIRVKHKRISGMAGRRIGKSNAMAVRVLHKIFTNERFKVVIFTPYQAQLDTIWKMFAELIEGNPSLENMVTKNIKTPYRLMEFSNGQTIKGFVGGSGAVRSAAANLLWLDEASFLSPEDTDAVIALLAENADVELLVTSTPKGIKDWFWQTTQDEDFVTFHFPSDLYHPYWSEDMEREFKKQLTASGYKHEVLARISDDGEGVFQSAYIDESLVAYNYSPRPIEEGWVYIFGVDWNHEGIGTQIVVIGYNHRLDKPYRVWYRETIDIEGWTQLKSVQRIKELNRLWKPDFIYVDRGYGQTNVELLHEQGYNAQPDTPDSRLRKIVKPVYFSEKIEVKDPWTHEKEMKHVKPFMVNQTVKIFEDSYIQVNTGDEELKRQLENYIVERYTPAGVPVYGISDPRVGDHILDAIFLAILGFVMEGTKFGKTTSAKNIRTVSVNIRGGKVGTKKDIPIGGVVNEPENMATEKEKERKEVYESGGRTTSLNEKYTAFSSTLPKKKYSINPRSFNAGFSSRANVPRRKTF